jgi:hypothetical protein
VASNDDDTKRDEALGLDLSASAWRQGNPENTRGEPRGLAVSNSSELTRILNLQRRAVVTEGSTTAEAMIHLGMQKYGRVRDPISDKLAMDAHMRGDFEDARDIWKCNCRDIDPTRYAVRDDRAPQPCIARLLWIQAWMLFEIEQNGGCLGAITTGAGKTLSNLLAAIALRNCPLSMLLIPASLIDQIEIDYRLIAEHFRVPGLVIHQPGKKTWRADARFTAPNGQKEATLHVLPYTRLSSTESSAWIENLRPGAIIADECFTGDTLVITDLGPRRIDDVVDRGVGTLVLSFDKLNGQQVWRRITRRMRKPGLKTLVRVTHEHGHFDCTEDHKVWTEGNGYIHASALTGQTLLVVSETVPSEAAVKEVLPTGMRSGVERETDCRSTPVESGRDRCDRDAHLSNLSTTFQCGDVLKNNSLQCTLLESEHTCAETMSGMQDLIHTIQSETEILRPKLRVETPPATRQERPDVNREILSKVRPDFHDQTSGQDHSALLHKSVRNNVCVERSTETGLSSTPTDEPVRIQSECRDQSGSTGEDTRSNVLVTGRQRTTHETATQAGASTRTDERCIRILDRYEVCEGSATITTGPLLGGSRDPGVEVGDRGGWENPPDQALEIHRQTKDRSTTSSRVVSVEVLELGGRSAVDARAEQRSVYDLTVEDTHCYFANGVLVSNCDSLKSLESARTMRVARYMADHWRTTRFCGWTGSLTDSSISDFAHLSAWALRGASPMPLERHIVDEWGRCLDANPNPTPPGALIRMLEPGEPASMMNVRRAFRRRLAETPGFVMSSGRQVITNSAGEEVKITIKERVAPPIPERIQQALKIIRKGRRPETLVGGKYDDIFETPMQQVTCARVVATGILHYWIFPNGEPDELIDEWFLARSMWFSELRRYMLGGRLYLDSQKLCENAAKRAWGDLPHDANLPEWPAENWPRWRDIMNRVEPEAKAARLDSFLVDDCAAWAVEKRGIIWYEVREFATWVQERAQELYGVHLPIFGEGAGAEIVKERGDRSIIASLEAHGRGRDRLQFSFSNNILAQLPSSDRRLQQFLARTHRRGQQATEVSTELYQHTEEIQASLDSILRKGEYVEAVTGEARKFIEGWR